MVPFSSFHFFPRRSRSDMLRTCFFFSTIHITLYSGEEDTVTWDEEMIYGCVCDSAWEVGLDAGQTQEPEWFGPDCSLRHCPSGDDPVTLDDETDCSNVTSTSVYSGTAVSIIG